MFAIGSLIVVLVVMFDFMVVICVGLVVTG